MSTSVDIGTLIARAPQIHAGRPLIAGTGITVGRIARWYKLGLGPEAIGARIGHLTLAQVYAALAYYHANRDVSGSPRPGCTSSLAAGGTALSWR